MDFKDELMTGHARKTQPHGPKPDKANEYKGLVTSFWDMHTRGYSKTDFDLWIIEAAEDEARSVFYARTGRNPDAVSCTCCGQDFCVTEEQNDDETFSTADEVRDLHVQKKYHKLEEICIIRHHEIEDEDRHLDIPVQGFVWQG